MLGTHPFIFFFDSSLAVWRFGSLLALWWVLKESEKVELCKV